jgi:ribosomal protein L37AE/L43A
MTYLCPVCNKELVLQSEYNNSFFREAIWRCPGCSKQFKKLGASWFTQPHPITSGGRP